MLNPPLTFNAAQPHQNEDERRQNAHAAKTRLRAATAHVGVSRIRSASGEYREAENTERTYP